MTRFDLPAGFEELAVFSDWAIASEKGRHEKRLATSMEATTAFYGAMTRRIEEIFACLRDIRLESIDSAGENLLLLVLALQEIAIVVESFGNPVNPKAWPASKVRFQQLDALY